MVLDDVLTFAFGAVLGTLSFLPFALAIAASTVRSEARYLRNLRRPEVTTESPSKEIMVFDAEFRVVL